MKEWLKSWFKKADDVFDNKIVTEERVEILLNDFFAILHAGVAMSATPVDDLALAALETKIDKKLMASILAQRLRDLV